MNGPLPEFTCPDCKLVFPSQEAVDKHRAAATVRAAVGGPHLPDGKTVTDMVTR